MNTEDDSSYRTEIVGGLLTDGDKSIPEMQSTK